MCSGLITPCHIDLLPMYYLHIHMTYVYVYVCTLGNIKSLYIDTVYIYIYIYIFIIITIIILQCSVFLQYLILYLRVLYKQYCFPEPWFLGF